jgi:hypothetical protein
MADMAGQVKSLTTIATPHRGSYVADWFQANYRRRVPLLLALEALGVNVDGFRDCQLAACRALGQRPVAKRQPGRTGRYIVCLVGKVQHPGPDHGEHGLLHVHRRHDGRA